MSDEEDTSVETDDTSDVTEETTEEEEETTESETTSESTYSRTEISDVPGSSDDSYDSDAGERSFLLPQDILNLKSRHIRAEDENWGLSPIPNLADIIVKASKRIRGPKLENLMQNASEEQKGRILELLPLNIPLKFTLPVLGDGIYWKRKCLQYWPPSDIWRYDDKWKDMFVERSVQESIESFKPGESNMNNLVEYLNYFKDYVHRLPIKKLEKFEEKIFTIDLSAEDFDEQLDEFIGTPQGALYLNFEKVFSCIPKLEDLCIFLTPRCLDFETFHLSTADFNCLLRGIKKFSDLQKFRLSNALATNDQLNIITRLFLTHKSLSELDLSYNFIDDHCCEFIGKLLLSSCPLRSLTVKCNRITDDGAMAIAAALSENSKLKKLDLSLNLIGNKGGCFLAKIIACNNSINDLDISKNKLGSESGLAFADILKESEFLRSLQIEENSLGELAGRKFAEAMTNNETVLDLNIRFCGFYPEDEGTIHKALIRNRSKLTYSSYRDEKGNATGSEFIV